MSYISNPQHSASLLAEILTNMDPSQHDAVKLMNELYSSFAGISKALGDVLSREFTDYNNHRAQIDNVAALAAISIKHGVEINDLINAVSGSTNIAIQNGHDLNTALTALVESLNLNISNGFTANNALGLAIENANAELQQGNHLL